MVELARHEHQQDPLTAVVIAERRHIPEKYLVHILLQLKRAGLARSVRGAQGGYLLAKSPDTITLLDIVQAIDGPILSPHPVEDQGGADLEPMWREVAEGIARVLSSVCLRDILDQSARTDMYYI